MVFLRNDIIVSP